MFIEILADEPVIRKGAYLDREGKERQYNFATQLARWPVFNRRGHEEIKVVEIQVEPDKLLQPRDGYVVDPRSFYQGEYETKAGKKRQRMMIGRDIKLVHVTDLSAAFQATTKPALKAA
ncbi:hypothetical protein [Sphingomonas oryzagri]